MVADWADTADVIVEIRHRVLPGQTDPPCRVGEADLTILKNDEAPHEVTIAFQGFYARFVDFAIPATEPLGRSCRMSYSGGIIPQMSSLADLPWWTSAMTQLRQHWETDGKQAEADALDYARRYQAKRAAMVFDVVASRQRKYTQVVQPKAERFAATRQAESLKTLAAEGPGDGYGLRTGEAETMRQVAAGLHAYCDKYGYDDDSGCKEWADNAAPFEHATKLEPYVGTVKGMGPALFAYLRMRSGGDAIKPDLRVRHSLNRLGFNVPNDAHAILVVANTAATELGTSKLVFDQLLWRATD